MATDYKPADLNKDGTVTAKERAKYKQIKDRNAAAAGNKPKPGSDEQDRLTRQELERRFGFAKDVIWQDPSLRALYQRAIKEQMPEVAFQAALRDTDWWKNNADYARKAWTAAKIGGADWQAQLEEGRLAVEEWAVQNGARLSNEQKDQLARRYWFQGWNDPDRKALMQKELSAFITNDEGFMRGESGGIQQAMMETARKNGMKFSDEYFQSAARSVASGMTTEEDWLREIREQAASKWPTFSDKIMSGLDMQDLASGYINTMADVFEVDKSSISLDDPYIRQALQGIDDKGNPSMESLWDFEYRLKSDPKWLQTKNGANETADVGMNILRLMGFTG